MTESVAPQSGRYLFVHLQKTAGTALLRRLRHHFGPDGVYPTPAEQGGSRVVLDVEHMLSRVNAPASGLHVVTGHFPLAAADLIEGPVSTFTVLRDPVERVLSFLRHQREVEPRFADSSLEEIYEDPVSTGGLVQNHMVKMLSLTSGEMTNGALTAIDVDEWRLEQACRNLELRIDVMGLQEHFDAFCRDLEATFGWDLGEPLFMNRTQPMDESEELRSRIGEDNRYDQHLYRRASELWHRRHD